MTRWLIELHGDDFDVSEFPRWFPNGDIHAVAETGKYYLAGEAFAAQSDPAAVFEMATTAVHELFSIIHLLEPSVKMPSIGNVLLESDDGSRRGYAFASALLSGRSKLTADLSFASADTVATHPTQAQRLLIASRTNRNLQIAVLLLANTDVTWPHLYRSLEEIETFLGRTVSAAGLWSSNQRERFSRSANSAEVSGTDSRHGLGQFVPPRNPMTLGEARSFVSDVLQTALTVPRADS